MSLPVRGPLGVVIVAAGEGLRYGDPAKTLSMVGGKPMVEHSLRLFASNAMVEHMVVVFGQHTLAEGARIVASLRLRDVAICVGGSTRGASVRAGVRLLDPAVELVAIHDAARPLATSTLVQRVVVEARRCGAAVPVLPVTDTVLRVDSGNRVLDAPDRSCLQAAQTPQVARRDWLERALADSDTMTDEASLLHFAGFPVTVVAGEPDNIKITQRVDIALAEALLATRTADA